MKSARLFNSLFYLSSLCIIASFYYSYLAFFAFLPLFFYFDKKSPITLSLVIFLPFLAFLYSGIFKSLYIYYGLNIAAAVVLYCFIVLYHFLYIYLPIYINKRLKYSVLFLPFLLVAFEYLKSNLLYGFPLGNLNILVYNILPFIKSASYFGAYFVSLNLLFINLALYYILFNKHRVVGIAILLTSSLVLFLPYSKTIYSFKEHIAIVQGNIPQSQKWERAYLDRNLGIYLQESSDIDADIVFWPESSYPYLFEESNNALSNLVKLKRYALVAGVVRKINDKYLNSVVLITSSGSSYYDKQKLVPFAEFIPFRTFFGLLIPESLDPGDFYRGKTGKILKYDKLKMAPMICYEEAFPEIARQYSKLNANLLVVLTNDAWFDNTPTFFMLHRNAIFRAVENAMWLVRTANTGVSEIVEPNGFIYASLNSGKRAVLSKDITISKYKQTVFSKYGYHFGFLLFLMVSLLIFYRIYRLQRAIKPNREAK